MQATEREACFNPAELVGIYAYAVVIIMAVGSTENDRDRAALSCGSRD